MIENILIEYQQIKVSDSFLHANINTISIIITSLVELLIQKGILTEISFHERLSKWRIP